MELPPLEFVPEIPTWAIRQKCGDDTYEHLIHENGVTFATDCPGVDKCIICWGGILGKTQQESYNLNILFDTDPKDPETQNTVANWQRDIFMAFALNTLSNRYMGHEGATEYILLHLYYILTLTTAGVDREYIAHFIHMMIAEYLDYNPSLPRNWQECLTVMKK